MVSQPPASPAVASPKGGAVASINRVLGIVIIVTVLGAAGYTVLQLLGVPAATPSAPGLAPADLPPVGQIWFGTSFDPTTFAVSGRATTFTSGTTVALVAHSPRSIGSGEGNLRITLDGQTINNSALQIAGEGELYGVTYPLPVPGTYTFAITDLGGNVLASGSVTAR